MKRVGHILAGLSLALVGLLSLAPAAKADTFQTYNLAWSGTSFGNTANASGTITLDLTTLLNPTVPGGLGGTSYYDILSDITSLTVTVTGASAGNGTFTLANLCACSVFGSDTYWNTNGATLNMGGNVLSQLTAAGGDFNLFFTPPGPQGSNVLVLTTDGLGGDPMSMTSFNPTSTPEPSSVNLMLIGIGLAFVMRKRLAKGLQEAS
jgi:hypothetical protein